MWRTWMQIGLVNEEQERIIELLENVVTLLKSVHVKNEEALVHIRKPLEWLEASLKCLPIGPSFNEILPTEIKDKILSYLCVPHAFIAASVCQEWKEVIEKRFNKKRFNVENYGCRCSIWDYINSTEILKASATHKMDVHLVLNHDITKVDSKIVTDALTTVSKFTIAGQCYDEDDESFDSWLKETILSSAQLEHLIEGLEQGDKVMEKVEILNFDLTNLNPEKLARCLVNKVKRLTLDSGESGDMLDAKTFVNELKKGSTSMNLSHLTLHHFEKDYDDSFEFDLGKTLCEVENVRLAKKFDLESFVGGLKGLIDNVITCTQPVTMKTLIIEKFIEFGLLLSPEDLRNLFKKLTTLHIHGGFTKNQLDAVKSLPDVTLDELSESSVCIMKGSNEIF